MNLRELVQEIHRRSVWQVVSVYLVGSWIALQVVQTLTASLGLPEWFPSLAVVLLIVGFPVVLATAIVQEGPPGADAEGPPGADAYREGAPPAASDEPPAPASGGVTSGVSAADAAPTSAGASAPGPSGSFAGGLRSVLTWPHALTAGVVTFALWGVVAAGWLLLGGAPAPGSGHEAGGGEEAGLSLAVLPLNNYTGADARQYLVDGLHEALIHELTKLEALTVKSRTSVMRFRGGETSIPEISRSLGGVERVVEGSVFQLPESDSLRVTVQLIDARTDEHVWSREYWGELRQIRDLQARVVRGIAAEVRVKISPGVEARLGGGEPLPSDAVNLYMQARAAWRTGSVERMENSISLYRQALEIEPTYAMAWAGLADAYLVLAHLRLPAHEAFPPAREAAERALELDGGLAEAHTALADVRFHYEWDWNRAEEGFRRALELHPGYVTAHWWYSGLLAALGRTDEAVARITRARELDPLSPQGHGFAVRLLYYARRHQDALDVVERIRQLGVSEFMTPPWAALARHALGETERALDELRQIPEEQRSPYVRTALVQLLAATGEGQAARRELAVLEAAYAAGRLPVPHLLAIGHAALGDRERALDWLERAAEDRDGALPWLTVDPAFDGLRSEPRYRALVHRMGLAAPDGQLSTVGPGVRPPAGPPAEAARSVAATSDL